MRRFVISMACLVLLTGFAGTRLARAAGQSQQPAATFPQKAAADSTEYVGQETCATCHEEAVKKFANNPHSRLSLEHAGKGVTCESCHGPGKAHVEGGGDVTKIRRFDKLSPKEIDQTCLGCHAGTHPNFERSPHAKADVSCLGCHSVHAAKTDVALLKAPQPQLCFQCHSDQKSAFNMPFHHPVNEGVVGCSDCHDVHGSFQANNLKSTADQNAVCTKCHAETRGPFVYEHAAVRAEGCLGCHSPHGSQNARMLNMPSINTLCNQCHSPVGQGSVHGMSAGSASYQPCTSCHTYIHGSNMNAAFLR
ncbi:MAG TPA: DmsE family decaheme c-type cytochrome [Acidobacteriaceae bacterium]|jgi:DmsE family decaheme c-type cytochrome|nr:DmsE family decaheme c-type cytochrome [Acidobacteriaceae bacterium]